MPERVEPTAYRIHNCDIGHLPTLITLKFRIAGHRLEHATAWSSNRTGMPATLETANSAQNRGLPRLETVKPSLHWQILPPSRINILNSSQITSFPNGMLVVIIPIEKSRCLDINGRGTRIGPATVTSSHCRRADRICFGGSRVRTVSRALHTVEQRRSDIESGQYYGTRVSVQNASE